MQRRKFITTTAIASAVALSTKAISLANNNKKGFVVKNKQSRFNEQTNIGGLNDIKVSTKDTGGALSIFEYNRRAAIAYTPFSGRDIFYSAGRLYFPSG